MNTLGTAMESTYSKAKVCKYGENQDGCEPTLALEPGIKRLFLFKTYLSAFTIFQN